MGGPLRLWGTLLTPTIQSWQQFLQCSAHHWSVPPLGPAFGPQMGGPLWLWNPYALPESSLGSSYSNFVPTAGWFLGRCWGGP